MIPSPNPLSGCFAGELLPHQAHPFSAAHKPHPLPAPQTQVPLGILKTVRPATKPLRRGPQAHPTAVKSGR